MANIIVSNCEGHIIAECEHNQYMNEFICLRGSFYRRTKYADCWAFPIEQEANLRYFMKTGNLRYTQQSNQHVLHSAVCMGASALFMLGKGVKGVFNWLNGSQ